uniref:Putative lectin/glucanase superfamily protein n=1 Tax=viral metagenome TaxID=1070528 RepID=A0A6M3K3S7_9ZZZZ
MRVVKTTMLTTADRYVTPSVDVRGYSRVALWAPQMDDSTAIHIEVAPEFHEYNYSDIGKGTPQDYAAAGVAAEWRMDDADGTTIVDSVNGISLAEQGNPTFASASATVGMGNGLIFDGTGDAFDILTSSIVPQSIMPTTGSFSVEVVGKYTNASIGAGDTIIACRVGAAGIGWQMEFDANQYIDFHVDDGTETVLTGATDVATGSEVHLFVTIDRRTQDGRIYVNGSVDDSTALTSSVGTVFPTAGATTRLSIGGDAAQTAGDCLYGTIYLVRIYNRTFTAAEVLDKYRVAMNQGYPGWTRLADDYDGEPFVVRNTVTTARPVYMKLKHDFKNLDGVRAMRAVCTSAQTTTPAALDFYWELS